MKKFKETRVNWPTLIAAILVIVVIILVLNPKIIPFISEDAREALNSYLSDYYSLFGNNTPLSLARILSAATVMLFIFALNRIVMFIIGHIKTPNARSKTMLGVTRSIVNYTMFFIAVLWALSRLGVNVAGMFAGIGVVSLIIGFGAQSLIEDVITGFFIIFEGQYNVGDIIVLDNFRGEVRKIGVRTTTLEDAGGQIKIVNNSDVRNLENRSRKPSPAVCDIGIGYDENLEAVEKIINDALPQIKQKQDKMFKDELIYLGVQQLAESSVVLRIIGHVNEKDIYDAQRFLNREMKLLLDKNNINIPYPQMDVHKK